MAAGIATQVLEWATTHRYCGRCATPTERRPRRALHALPRVRALLSYPRIAPAVIVLVRRGEEALLARGARFPLPFYSTLAGFVEIGETLEQTVSREIREEVGIEVRGVPLLRKPALAVPALAHGRVHRALGRRGTSAAIRAEIVEAAWFRRDALPPIPPPLSIARRLIDAWLREGSGSS